MKIKSNIFMDKDFSLLMFGKFISLIGTQMQNFALSLYVLKITGSATKFATVLAVTVLPQIVLGPAAGVFVDWFDRKKIIVYLDMLNGIIAGIFAAIFMINGKLSLGSIYGLVIAMSLASLLFQPAINTVIPTIVKKEKLVDANGINSFILNLGSFAAPAIAGIIMGVYGLFVIFAINSVSFILSAVSEMFINIPATNKKPEQISIKSFANNFSEGIRFIKGKRILTSIITLACFLNFAVAPVGSLGMIYISKNILKITDLEYGILESIFVVSMMIAPFIASKVSKKFKMGEIVFWDVFITSLFIALMAVIPSKFYLSLFSSNLVPYISLIIINFMIGLITTIGNISFGTMMQQEVPLYIMGRVGTVMSTGAMVAMPLGQMLFGFLFDKIEIWMCIFLSSVIIFTIIMIVRKSLYNDDKTEVEKTIYSESNTYSVDNEELIISSPEVSNAISQED